MWTSFKVILGLIFNEKSSIKFAIGVFLGLGFPISVILPTIGIMDGFELSLRQALKKSTGDLQFYSRKGFFNVEGEISSLLAELGINEYTAVIQSQGFAIRGKISKGVLVRGVEPESYAKVTGVYIKINEGQVALGAELAKRLKVKNGEDVVLALANGNTEISALPQLTRFKVGQIIKHEIYQKDSRMFYLAKKRLKQMMQLRYSTNNVLVNLASAKDHAINKKHTEKILVLRKTLKNALGSKFAVFPYWHEFSSLIQAVEVEKFVIGIILQLVVIISVFNVLAFIIFLNEGRSRELFLIRALGIGRKRFTRVWLLLIALLWSVSCFISIFMVKIFDIFLRNFSFFESLSDIYNIGTLSLSLDLFDYILVFVLALAWLFLISWFGLARLKKISILKGLRKEFA